MYLHWLCRAKVSTTFPWRFWKNYYFLYDLSEKLLFPWRFVASTWTTVWTTSLFFPSGCIHLPEPRHGFKIVKECSRVYSLWYSFCCIWQNKAKILVLSYDKPRLTGDNPVAKLLFPWRFWKNYYFLYDLSEKVLFLVRFVASTWTTAWTTSLFFPSGCIHLPEPRHGFKIVKECSRVYNLWYSFCYIWQNKANKLVLSYGKPRPTGDDPVAKLLFPWRFTRWLLIIFT